MIPTPLSFSFFFAAGNRRDLLLLFFGSEQTFFFPLPWVETARVREGRGIPPKIAAAAEAAVACRISLEFRGLGATQPISTT